MEKIIHQLPTVLITDDDQKMREILREILELKGFNVLCARDGIETIKIVERENIDVVLLDIILPRKNGLDVLKEISEKKPHLPVVMISGRANVQIAVEATKLGAYDFLEKPLDADRVVITLKNAIEKSSLAKQIAFLRKKSYDRYHMLGVSDAMNRVFDLIDSSAPTKGRILITGESGTGKELVALAIHDLSHRNTKPLIKINCAAIHEELIESELFGHRKGSFTGAIEDKDGVFQRANNSTLFLDEIGDMSFRLQAKVLRALEEGEIQKVGGNIVEEVDVRLISATNKNLAKQIEDGKFRDDLYYRLNVVTIHISPLRDRREDIPILVNHYIKICCSENNIVTKEFSEDAMDVLKMYDWPGNIRELRNLVERMVIMMNPSILGVSEVRKTLFDFALEEKTEKQQYLKQAKMEFERTFIKKSLNENAWNITRTAREIGIDRTQLHKKMKKLKLFRS